MEKRIGNILLKVYPNADISILNKIISNYSEIIIGRMGIPLRQNNFSLISLIIEADTDIIGAFTGKLGKCKNIKVKSNLFKLEGVANDI